MSISRAEGLIYNESRQQQKQSPFSGNLVQLYLNGTRFTSQSTY